MNEGVASIIGMRAFSMEDQCQFANISGDCNPIHLDALYARRCLTGGVVVHGMHTLLWALNCWMKHSIPGPLGDQVILRLRAKFVYPLRIGCIAECWQSVGTAGKTRLEVVVSGRQTLLIDLVEACEGSGTIKTQPRHMAPRTDQPKKQDLNTLEGLSGSWTFAIQSDMGELLSHLTDGSCGNWPTFLALSSRLIGMECPGLNSLLSGLDLNLSMPSDLMTESDFLFQVTHVDDRFKRVTLAVQGGGIAGEIQAFIRPEPVDQPCASTLSSLVPRQSFANQRALVIGGSRGLGEVAAKLLAGGGADVCLTYHVGRDEAMAVVHDIGEHAGRAHAVAYDVNAGIEMVSCLPDGWRPTHLYYFATPFIPRGNPTRFSGEMFACFSSVYVSGFSRLVQELLRYGLSSVLYPSTAALETFPSDMAEYCTAKAAGETACQILVRKHRDLHIECIRFPRMATDETASMLPVKTLDPVSHVLGALLRLSESSKVERPTGM